MPPITSTPLSKAPSQLLLIPWDPASPDHVQRLVNQRIACGWDHEAVKGWRAKQESGDLNQQWIVLDDSDPEKDAKLLKHAEVFPQEAQALVDTAISFGGRSRIIPSPQKTFIPIGHVCLGHLPSSYRSLGLAETDGVYWISNFYISGALQGNGLGSTALDTVENIAISEPLCAKVLALNAIDKKDPDRQEKYKALGLKIPLFSNQEWYERRGYQLYNNVEKLFSKVDSTGKSWYWNAVFLKKEI